MDPSTLSDEDFERLVGCMHSANMIIVSSISTAEMAREWLLGKYTLHYPSLLDTRIVKFMNEPLDQVPLYVNIDSKTIRMLASWRLTIAR